MSRDQRGVLTLRALCVLGILAGIALVVRGIRHADVADSLLAGLGGIGCGAGLLRFSRTRPPAA